MSEPTMVAQLAMFGLPPKIIRERPHGLFVWAWAGIPIPPSEDALRQARLMGWIHA